MISKGQVNNFVCRNIRLIRVSKGISVGDVAEKTGMPTSSYSCLEWGRFKINLDNLFHILHAIGASITDVWPMADVPVGSALDSRQIAAVMKESERLRPPEITVDKLIEAVCQVWGIDRMDREVARRSKSIRECQVVSAIIVRELPQITLTSLSQRLEVNISSLYRRTRRLLALAESDEIVRAKIKETREAVLELLAKDFPSVSTWHDSRQLQAEDSSPQCSTESLEGRSMPSCFHIDPREEIAYTTATGNLSDEDLQRYKKRLVDHPDWKSTFTEICDLRGVTGFKVTSNGLRHLVQMESSQLNQRGVGKCAIVASSDISYGMARMYEAFADELPYPIAVFRDLDQARQWLEPEG